VPLSVLLEHFRGVVLRVDGKRDEMYAIPGRELRGDAAHLVRHDGADSRTPGKDEVGDPRRASEVAESHPRAVAVF
jgi:hypothetical protein